MIRLYFIVLFLAFGLVLKAQNPNYDPNGSQKPFLNIGPRDDPYFKDYLKIKGKAKEDQKLLEVYERKLIVVLEEEDPDKLKYFKSSPKKLAFYKQLIQSNNDLLASLIPKYWRQIYSRSKNSDTILFKSHKECLELSKTKCEDYFTIEFSSIREGDNEFLFDLAGKSPEMDFRKELIGKVGELGKFEIKLIENFSKTALHSFFTITSFPNELDFIVAIQQMGNFFLERFKFLNRTESYEEEIAKRREDLKKKILLVDSSQVERRSNGFSFIQEVYSLPYKLTDYKGILEAIKNKDTSYVYATVLPVFTPLGNNSFENTSKGAPDGKEGTLSHSHLLISSESSEVLMYIKNESRILNKKSWQRYAGNFD